MPTHFLGRIEWKIRDDDPKNIFAINPCFRHQFDPLAFPAGVGWQDLANDLLAAVDGWTVSAGATKVKLYQLGAGPSGAPKAVAEARPTTYRTSFGPTQVAVALSYYAGQNVKRKRGRLFIPHGIAGVSSSDLASQNVPAAVRTKVAALVPLFAGLGGTNVDWIVWSRVSQTAAKVTDWWIDDSWDVIRSRKLKGTTRTTGTTGG